MLYLLKPCDSVLLMFQKVYLHKVGFTKEEIRKAQSPCRVFVAHSTCGTVQLMTRGWLISVQGKMARSIWVIWYNQVTVATRARCAVCLLFIPFGFVGELVSSVPQDGVNSFCPWGGEGVSHLKKNVFGTLGAVLHNKYHIKPTFFLKQGRS